jgi:hypothetical protein
MGSDFIPATTGLSRVFLQEGRAGPDNPFEYMSTLRAMSLTKPMGDVTKIEVPHPTRPGQYVRIGQFQTGDERATITLEGRFALDLRSRLMRLAKTRCPVDVQLHFGDCEDLSDPKAWKKILFLEEAILTSYGTEDLGSLQDADTAAVNETVELSAGNIYDATPAVWSRKADDIVTTEIVAGTVDDAVNCGGDCGAPSGGCSRIFLVSTAAGGSPGTPPDVVYSLDGGLNWRAQDIDTITTALAPSGIDLLKGYVVISCSAAATDGIHITPVADLDAFGKDAAFTRVTTGFVTGAGPTCIHTYGTKSLLGGLNGRIYQLTDPTAGVTVLENGSLAPVSQINDIDAYSERFWVAVGNQGVIMYTEDGKNFLLLTTSPVGIGVNIRTVAVKSKVEWWIGTSDGRIFYTRNKGLNWTWKRFSGDNAGVVYAIHIANDSVMYFSHSTAAPLGRIFASFNGGRDFQLMPQGSAIMPNAQRFTVVAPCHNDPELVVAAGLAGPTGSDGIVVVGKM